MPLDGWWYIMQSSRRNVCQASAQASAYNLNIVSKFSNDLVQLSIHQYRGFFRLRRLGSQERLRVAFHRPLNQLRPVVKLCPGQ